MTDLPSPPDHDPDLMRAIAHELRAVHELLAQFSHLAAELPDIDLERAAGIGAAAALVAGRLRQIEQRTGARYHRPVGVVVVNPDRCSWMQTPDGQPLLPVVSAPEVDGVCGVSSGICRLAAGATSSPRVHATRDVIVVVLFGSAVLTWWDERRQAQRVRCLRHQHVHIPRGTPYALGNPGAVPLLAVLAQSGADVTAGVQPRPDLDHGTGPDPTAGIA